MFRTFCIFLVVIFFNVSRTFSQETEKEQPKTEKSKLIKVFKSDLEGKVTLKDGIREISYGDLSSITGEKNTRKNQDGNKSKAKLIKFTASDLKNLIRTNEKGDKEIFYSDLASLAVKKKLISPLSTVCGGSKTCDCLCNNGNGTFILRIVGVPNNCSL